MNEQVYHYTIEDGIQMVEVHVDLLPVQMRQDEGTKVRIHGVKGISMGGKLSVRYNATEWAAMYSGESLPPIGIKVGTDEVNFKMYAMAKKYWTMDRKKKIAPKNEGKGNMKVAWVDEVMGLAYNHLPTALLDKFQSERPKRHEGRVNGILAYNPGKGTLWIDGHIVH